MPRRLPHIVKPIAVAVVLVGVIVAIIVPTVRAIGRIHAATIAEHQLLEERYQRGRILHRVLREFAAMRDAIAEIRARVPSSTRGLEIIERIERIATVHGLTETVTIREPMAPTRGDVGTMPITIELRGSFPDVTAALRDIERLPTPLRTTALSIASTAARGGASTTAFVVLRITGELPWIGS